MKTTEAQRRRDRENDIGARENAIAFLKAAAQDGDAPQAERFHAKRRLARLRAARRQG